MNAAPPTFDSASQLPALRQDLDLYPGPRERDGGPSWTIHDPLRNRFYRIGPLQFAILHHWGTANVGRLLERINQGGSGLQGTLRDVAALVQFLANHQLLVVKGGEARQRFIKMAQNKPGPWQWLLHHYLFFRIPLVRPDRFLDATLGYVKIFFHPFVFPLLLVLGGVGGYLISRQWEVFIHNFSYFFNFSGLLYFGSAVVLGKIIHELGHAYTAKYYGLKVPTMGVAFMVLWPVLYTDATDAWKLSARRQRLAITTAGVRTELGLALLATFCWGFLPDGPWRSACFMLATSSWLGTLAINLNPFMRFDGYYFLSDLLDVPNLQNRAFAMGRWRVREFLFGLGDAPPQAMGPGLRRFLVGYALCTWLYRLILFLSIALLVYYMFFKILGIALMAVEVAWFVVLPIWQEMGHWYALRDRLALNWQTSRFALLLVTMGLLLFYPWQGQLGVPGVLRAEHHTQIYPPISGQIAEVLIQRGEMVAEGQPLFLLASPDNVHQITQIERQIRTLNIRLQRRAMGAEYLDQSRILEQELEEATAKLDGLLALRDKLTMTAPFAGRIVELADALTPGRWVNETLALAQLLSPEKAIIEGYIAEEEIAQLPSGSGISGVFVPEVGEVAMVPILLRTVEESAVRRLDQPVMASTHGGPLAVREGRDGSLTPETPVYRLLWSPVQPTPIRHPILRGTLLLEGVPRSYAGRFITHAASVVLRESGF